MAEKVIQFYVREVRNGYWVTAIPEPECKGSSPIVTRFVESSTLQVGERVTTFIDETFYGQA